MNRAVVIKRIEIDMGHRIPYHASKCSSIHGHRYVFEAEIEGPVRQTPQSGDEGMVLDFADVKDLMMRSIHDPWDHGLMLSEKDPFRPILSQLPDQKIVFVPFVPTAENIAGRAFELLAAPLAARGLELKAVTVWETPGSRARVERRTG